MGKGVSKKNPDIRTDRIKKITMDEGMCVQILHVGSYDTERESVKKIETYMEENNLASDFSDVRRHHEIYLSDPRRTIPEKYRTIIRHPVKEKYCFRKVPHQYLY